MTLLLQNGQWKTLSDDALSPFYSGVAHGMGLFETLRFRQGQPCFFHEHLQRMKTSAQTIGWDWRPASERWHQETRALLQAIGAQEGILKWMLVEQGDRLDEWMFVREVSQRKPFQSGWKLCNARHSRPSRAFTTNHKTLNYADNLLEKRFASSNGFDEAIFVNEHQFLTEGCMSNLFFVREGLVCTPSLKNGLLPGIIRNKAIHALKKMGWLVEEGEYGLESLMEAEEVFLTNSNHLVAAVQKFSTEGQTRCYSAQLSKALFEALEVLETSLL